MELQVGVKALLKNSEGKYLLVRRNPKKYPEVGPQWDIIGGRIDSGTPLLDNLKREIKEEVNMELVEKPLLIAAQDILRVPNRHVIRLTFIGNIEGQPSIDEDHLEAKWFSAHEIKNLKPEELDPYFRELVEGKIIEL
jgi:ADP-ribose pyrophosphatase YjhB (NUDIX family)